MNIEEIKLSLIDAIVKMDDPSYLSNLLDEIRESSTPEGASKRYEDHLKELSRKEHEQNISAQEEAIGRMRGWG
ncbi:MAG: hypothetical protein JXQ87_18660 [Bacteroidia bacterium]